MFKSQGMFLKWRLPVSHAWMAGISRFGKKTQICQAQGPDHFSPLFNQVYVNTPAYRCVNKHQTNKEYPEKNTAEK